MAFAQNLRVGIKGVRPLLMHSPQGADPMSKWAKEAKALSSQRVKTDEVYTAMAKHDWYAGFYADSKGRPIVPAHMLMSSCVDGAKRSKLGKALKAAFIIHKDVPLIHDHPKGVEATIDDFWNSGDKYIDGRFVKIGTARVLRYRPIFRSWACEFEVHLTDMDSDVFRRVVEAAGMFCGIMDNRPTFGTYEVTKFEVIKS